MVWMWDPSLCKYKQITLMSYDRFAVNWSPQCLASYSEHHVTKLGTMVLRITSYSVVVFSTKVCSDCDTEKMCVFLLRLQFCIIFVFGYDTIFIGLYSEMDLASVITCWMDVSVCCWFIIIKLYCWMEFFSF